MDFRLADPRGLTAMLGDALREPLLQGAQRSLPDDDVVAALRAVEDLGRWVDAARLSIAGEIGARSQPGALEVPLVTAYGCGNAAELVERAAGISHATARTRLRAARAITARTTLTGQERPPNRVLHDELARARSA